MWIPFTSGSLVRMRGVDVGREAGPTLMTMLPCERAGRRFGVFGFGSTVMVMSPERVSASMGPRWRYDDVAAAGVQRRRAAGVEHADEAAVRPD